MNASRIFNLLLHRQSLMDPMSDDGRLTSMSEVGW
jgi:hypothetical protein